MGPSLTKKAYHSLLFSTNHLQIDPLSPTDGKVLVELFKLAKEERVLKIDEFLAYMKSKMDVRALYGSLNKLEKLNCIDRSDSDTEIRLIETIIFK